MKIIDFFTKCDGKIKKKILILSNTKKLFKMQILNFKVTKRETVGKKSTKALRRNKLVPCVLYGKEENIHFQASAKELRKLTNTPKTFLVNLDIDGKIYNAFLQDEQYHPVSDEALHLDFMQIYDDKPIKIQVPVKLEGFPLGVKEGGVLVQDKRYIQVLALAKHLPEQLVIKVDDLNIGDSIKVINLKFENLELIEGKSSIVAAVKLTRTAILEEDEESEEGEGEGSEGEESEKEKSE